MSSSVEDWLRSLGFIHYTQAFLDNGYDELEICKEIGKEDLDAIGVKNFKDRTDILNAVERLKLSGTAVYFELEAEGGNSSEPLQAQPERDTYTPLSLRMMLFDKLEEDKIDLTCAPYSYPNGSEGSLETLVTIYADKFYTYENDVLTALRTLRQRQVEKEGAFEDSPSQIPAPHPRQRARHSSKYKSRSSEERDDEEAHEAVSEDEFQYKSISSEDQTSPTRIAMNPADYLDVDSPAQRGKKTKKRRKVERNTKLSRSLDSLKELNVVVEPKPRDRESSSLKSKPFKWLYGSKKKNHNNKIKKQPLEKKPSNPSSNQDYNMLASAIQMSEEDRMALMIMVKQGELTVEEAVEQLKRYEEDCKKDDFLKPKGDLYSHDDDKAGNKPKLKRGLFGKSSKRKPNSRPSSEFIACEMTTMSEEDRINLMRNVKAGDMTVDQALKRFISYEEKHKKSDSDDVPVRESPKLPKGTGFSRISIKRVSGVISSSFRLPSVSNDQPNSVFYTEDGASADGSVSSGDEVLGTNDSSPAPSPKRLLANIQDLNKSQHSSTSSVDSMEKADEKPTLSSAPPHRQPNFMSEMKVVLGKQAQPVDNKFREGKEDATQPNQRLANNTSSKDGKPRPPAPDRKTSLPLMETQKVVLPPNPSGSLKRVPPDVPSRHGSALVAPHRPPPPIPSRPSPKETGEQRKRQSLSDETEATKSESAKVKADESRNAAAQTSESNSVEDEAYLEPVEAQAAVMRRPRNKPPPLPPRPASTSSCHEEPDISDARSVETQTSPRSPTSTQLDKNSEKAASTEEVYKMPPKPEPIDKAQLKPKPKPRPRPKRALTPDKLDEPYTEVPPPRPVLRGSAGDTRTHGETSRNELETNVNREESKPSNVKRTEPRASQNGRQEDSNLKPSPVPAPRLKRASHSLGEMIERKLHIENIDLTQEPYTDRDGCWGVPVNLIDRYAEELHRPHEEIACILERIRVRKLQEADKQVVQCNVSELDFTRNTLGSLGTLNEWLTSLGLPMYENSLTEVEYDNMVDMPYMEERHFQYAGISDPRHMRRLLASVEEMPR